MVAQTIQLAGKRFVIVEESEFERLRVRAAVAGDIDLPELPARLPSGNYSATEALRVGLARKLIARRWSAGLTQSECARRAGIRPETLNRIERAKVTVDTKTIARIDRVLNAARKLRKVAT